MITTDNAVKSMIEQHIALNRVEATSRDLTRLYAVSATIGAIADLRADSIAQVPMRVKNPQGEVVKDHPLCKIFKGGSSFTDLMRRSELSQYFWGRNLLHKQRNAFLGVTGLRWINPNLYSLDTLSREGLRGFRIHLSPQYQAEPVTYIPLNEAIYMHGVDFDDDFDGVAPAERAFLEASIEPERAQTALATFRNLAIPAAIIQPAAEDSQRTISNEEERTFIDRLRRLAQGALNAGRVIIAKRRYEYVQMQTPLKDMAMSDIAQEARLSIAIASRVPLELIQPSAANYAQFEGARRTWAHAWLVPQCHWYASLFTEQLAVEYGEGWTIEPDFDAVPFLKEDAATRVNVINSKVAGGLLTLYDAQKEAGQTPDEALRDVYMIAGVGPVPASEVKNLWNRPPVLPGGNFPVTQPSYSPSAFGGTASVKAAPLAYASLSLADDAQIMAVQDALRKALGDVSGIRWTPHENLHITLIYTSAAADEQLKAIAHAVKAAPVEVKAAAFGVFEHDGERALYLQVTPTETLLELQRTLYTAFKAHDLPLSEFSEPAAYKPHITLGYLPAETVAPILPVDVVTQADQVVFQRDDYRTFTLIPLRARAFIPEAQYRESKNWEAIALRRGGNYPFELKALANEPAAAYVNAALPMLDGDQDGIRLVFDHARELLALKKKRDLSGLVSATPEEYAAYWGEYDALMQQLGDDWLTEYMRRGLAALGRIDRSVSSDEVMRALEAGRGDLVEAWIGTEDAPGTLTQLMYAGMAAGNEALIRNLPPKPSGRKAALTVDWTLESREARQVVQQYAFDLIRRLDATTRAQMQAALDAWLASGDSLDALHDTLTQIFKDEARARLIAQTESTRAYAEGSRQRWQNVGVKQARFQTVMDAHVCPICAPLHNTVADLETGWKNAKGQYRFPPLHPGCRCFSKPIIDEELVNTLEDSPFGVDFDAMLRVKQNEYEQVRAQVTAGENSRVNDLKRERRVVIREKAVLDADIERLMQQLDRLDRDQRETLTAMRAESDRLNQENGRMRTETRTEQERARQQALETPGSPEIEVGYNSATFQTPDDRRQVITASEWVQRMFDGEAYPSLPSIDVNEAATGRESHQHGDLYITPTTASDEIIHEIGHALEERFPEIHRRAIEFLERRRTNDTPQPLRDLVPGSRYDANEVAFAGRFIDPYIGKVYFRDDGSYLNSEVISMGLQLMYNDPEAFAQADPEYFDLILAVMRRAL